MDTNGILGGTCINDDPCGFPPCYCTIIPVSGQNVHVVMVVCFPLALSLEGGPLSLRFGFALSF